MSKIKFSLFALIIIGIVQFSCGNKPESEEVIVEEVMEESPEDIMKIIDETNKEIEALYREGNIDEAATHFASNAIQFPPNQPPIMGIEEYKSRWKESAAMGLWNFDLQVQEVKSSGNLAVERGKYTLTFEPNEGTPIPPMSDEGNYVVLWEKIDGEWKVLWDAPVSTVPMPMPEM